MRGTVRQHTRTQRRKQSRRAGSATFALRADETNFRTSGDLRSRLCTFDANAVTESRTARPNP